MKLSLDNARAKSHSSRSSRPDSAPSGSRFRHQAYTDAQPQAACQWLRPQPGPPPASREFRYRMRLVGDAYRAADVAAVYLVQGTFAALDAGDMLAELARQYAPAQKAIVRLAAEMIDPRTGDAGNFTTRYADAFSSMATGGGEEMSVRLFHWSCENHHLGRADAAVRLIDEIASLELPRRKRILLWGHSHAGNVFALVSNLLSGDREAIEEFFGACRVYYRLPWAGIVDVPVWQRVYRLLTNEPARLTERPLDFVTFGTPIRYGWDRRGHHGLLHFVNHRPAAGRPLHRAGFPPALDDVIRAAGGDYMQQAGVAGTDTSPSRLAWRAWLANRRLARLLEQNLNSGDLIERLKIGMRVAETGNTILVDYGLPQGGVAEHLAGHAVYTRLEWLLFHAEQVAERFYASARLNSGAA